jgi:hypothetical protein
MRKRTDAAMIEPSPDSRTWGSKVAELVAVPAPVGGAEHPYAPRPWPVTSAQASR